MEHIAELGVFDGGKEPEIGWPARHPCTRKLAAPPVLRAP
jgi:hypothetical protein